MVESVSRSLTIPLKRHYAIKTPLGASSINSNTLTTLISNQNGTEVLERDTSTTLFKIGEGNRLTVGTTRGVSAQVAEPLTSNTYATILPGKNLMLAAGNKITFEEDFTLAGGASHTLNRSAQVKIWGKINEDVPANLIFIANAARDTTTGAVEGKTVLFCSGEKILLLDGDKFYTQNYATAHQIGTTVDGDRIVYAEDGEYCSFTLQRGDTVMFTQGSTITARQEYTINSGNTVTISLAQERDTMPLTIPQGSYGVFQENIQNVTDHILQGNSLLYIPGPVTISLNPGDRILATENIIGGKEETIEDDLIIHTTEGDVISLTEGDKIKLDMADTIFDRELSNQTSLTCAGEIVLTNGCMLSMKRGHNIQLSPNEDIVANAESIFSRPAHISDLRVASFSIESTTITAKTVIKNTELKQSEASSSSEIELGEGQLLAAMAAISSAIAGLKEEIGGIKNVINTSN